MEIIDFKKNQKEFYSASAKTPLIVNIPAMNFLMIDGEGNPNTSQRFKDVVEVLFSVSYTLKFMVKKGDMKIDYKVLPLEGIWWVNEGANLNMENKDVWKWTLMVRQPDFITKNMVMDAIKNVEKKKKLIALKDLRFESFAEGLSAQIMHVGPFSTEKPTVEKLHQFIQDQGYKKRAQHKEIYLSDTRKAKPETWKTIIRQLIGK